MAHKICKHVFIRNLPFDISNDEVTRLLRENFEEFETAGMAGTLNVVVYKPGISQIGLPQQVATVSGIRVASVENLTKRAKSLERVLRRCWLFYDDNGEKRDEFGERLHKFTPLEAKEKRESEGQPYRCVQALFKANFLKTLTIFNGSEVTHVRRLTADIARQTIRVGLVKDCFNVAHGCRIIFETSWDALQAICLYNSPNFVFCDDKFARLSSSNYSGGISGSLNNQGIIDVADLLRHHGYIPLSLINEDFFDFETIRKTHLLCWRWL